MAYRPSIAITMGDPAGIGPEVIIKALRKQSLYRQIKPVLIGNKTVFEQAIRDCNSKIRILPVKCPTAETFSYPVLPFVSSDTLEGITKKGKWSSKTGQASLAAVKLGVTFTLNKRVDALVTGPICKEAWHEIGVPYAGHTELLGKMTKTKHFSMMFVGGPFRLILATIHEPISRVPELINKSLIIQTGITGGNTLKRFFNIKKPHIAIAGLNPHAGESGLLGREEIQHIIPAVKSLAKRKNLTVSGPYPPDTLFTEAVKGTFDLIICMYHDQGLIPFKMLALHQGVNITAGLPIIRTSPDHGTGFNIAGKGIADPGSMIAAIKTAAQMALNARKNHVRGQETQTFSAQR